MTDLDPVHEGSDILSQKFPATGDAGIAADQTNPAIRLYGRRFYKDQTPVEYLSEFLLVFASPKGEARKNAFSLTLETENNRALYWPKDRVALKLFSFFPSSKLDTRHSVHQEIYLRALEKVKNRISGSSNERDEAIRLLQSFFAGFVGVAKTRTWVTQSFLPASDSLLAREVTWNHPAAVRGIRGEVKDWSSSTVYFDSSTHNFFGRGGELLFLQLANLFSAGNSDDIQTILPVDTYRHLSSIHLSELRVRIESGLRGIISNAEVQIGLLANFIDSAIEKYKLPDNKTNETRLGWVPKATKPEALLFAAELHNIVRTALGSLEKLELLQLLCVMQVMRSLCFQARRIDEHEKPTTDFIGNYIWILANPVEESGKPMRKLAQSSLERIEGLLYRVLRSPRLGKNDSVASDRDLKNGDDNCFRHFRKFGKEIGMIIPRTGGGQRFVLPAHLLRFLVAALIAPGDRVPLTEFYSRVFAHYGIALGERQLATALDWSGIDSGSKDYAVAADTGWVEEALQQGGFLVELSDAVSIVHNPGE